MRLRHVLGLAALALGVAALDVKDAPHIDDYDDLSSHPGSVCRISKPDDCYPQIFEPTDEFQVIRKHQDIPAGLHVRVDMQTGEKEAKLYDPTTDTDPVNAVAIEDVADNDEGGQAVQIIPGETLRDETPTSDDLDVEQIKEQAQKVLDEMRQAKAEQAEVIRPPVNAGGDSATFESNIEEVLRSINQPVNGESGEKISHALEELEDLCHDIYWGNELIKRGDFVAALPQLDTIHGGQFRDEASMVLSAALRNNAAALKELEKLEAVGKQTPGASDFSLTEWAVQGLDSPFGSPTTISRSLSLLSAMAPRETFAREVLRIGPTLLALVDAKAQSDVGKGNRPKLGNLLEDAFFNPDSKIWIDAWADEVLAGARGSGSGRKALQQEGRDAEQLCSTLPAAWKLWDAIVNDGAGSRTQMHQWVPGTLCEEWRNAMEKSEL